MRYLEPLLLVDDEETIRLTLCRVLQRQGFRVTAVGSGADALCALDDQAFGVVVTDLAMDGVTGEKVLKHALKKDADCCVIIITGFDDSHTAAENLRNGAFDCVAKPFDYDELLLRIARGAEHRKLVRRLRRYEDATPANPEDPS